MLTKMIDTKIAVLRIDVDSNTGEVMLLIETGCGFRPVMGWPNVNSLHNFADNLSGICSKIMTKNTSIAENSQDMDIQ